MNIITALKAQAGTIKANLLEGYVTLLIVVGLPAIAFMYVNWQLAVAVSIVAQITLGILSLKGNN